MNTKQFIPTLAQIKILNEYPLLAITARDHFSASITEILYWKADCIAHGGFLQSGRKDIKSCAAHIHSNRIY